MPELKLDNEGGSAREIIFQLYDKLKERYKNLHFQNQNFEFGFLNESRTLGRAIKNLVKDSPPYKREFVDYYLTELCIMEKAVSALEKYLAEE